MVYQTGPGNFFYQKDMIEGLPPGAGGVDDVMSIDIWIYRCDDMMM